jgi:hypothetical protein
MTQTRLAAVNSTRKSCDQDHAAQHDSSSVTLVRACSEDGCQGLAYFLAHGQSWADLRDLGMNDHVRSFRCVGYTCNPGTTCVPPWNDYVSVTGDFIDASLNDPRQIALMTSPVFLFSRAAKHDSCYPTNALDSNENQTPAAGRCAWPDTSCNCRTPGVSPGNPGPSFPVYISMKKCLDGESVGVNYMLFYEKDGFALAGGTAGHA